MRIQLLRLVFSFLLSAMALLSCNRAAAELTYPYYRFATPYLCLAKTCEDEGHWGSDLAIYSRYLWRGMQLSHGHPVLQPDLWLYYNGVKAMAWGNLDLVKYRFDQVNLYLDYSNDFDSYFLFSFGIAQYIFIRQKAIFVPKQCRNLLLKEQNGDNVSHCSRRRKQETELYLSIAAEDYLFLPALTVYREIGDLRGWAATLSAMYCIDQICLCREHIPFNMRIEADISWRSCRYNRQYYGVNSNSLADANLIISFPFCFKGRWAIAPTIKGTTLVREKFREARPHNSAHIAYGISFSGAW